MIYDQFGLIGCQIPVLTLLDITDIFVKMNINTAEASMRKRYHSLVCYKELSRHYLGSMAVAGMMHRLEEVALEERRAYLNQS